ncbi:hypothetical protein BGZ76_009309 [Entomortierella beljakovae]|nr:hypothetical protein BGZ76_009309 [Entomortierella beljakovae]
MSVTFASTESSDQQCSSDINRESLETLDENDTRGDTNDIDTVSVPFGGDQLDHIKKIEQEGDKWIITTPERDQGGLWSWITSSRVVSEEQRQFEEREERIEWEKHQETLKKLLGESFQEDSFKQSSFYLREKLGVASNERNKAIEKYQLPSPTSMTFRDWVVLSVLSVATIGVRFWRISWPDEVVLNEGHFRRIVSAYTKNEYAFDPHPPLGKLILAAVASFSDYKGALGFEDIGDQYPNTIPYTSMRAVLALMGALCAPTAYITLKANDQGTGAAILATIMIAFGKTYNK